MTPFGQLWQSSLFFRINVALSVVGVLYFLA